MKKILSNEHTIMRVLMTFCLSFFIGIMLYVNNNPTVDYETYVNDIKTTTKTETEFRTLSFDGIVYGEEKQLYAYSIYGEDKSIMIDEKIDEKIKTKVIIKELDMIYPSYDKREYKLEETLDLFYEIPYLNYVEEVSYNASNYTDIFEEEYNYYLLFKKSEDNIGIAISVLLSIFMIVNIELITNSTLVYHWLNKDRGE